MNPKNYPIAFSALLLWSCTNVLVGGSSAKIDDSGDLDIEVDSDPDIDTDAMNETCPPVDDYGSVGTVCYVDSVNGNDINSGLTPSSPLKTQSAVGPNCMVVRFKRGSRFDEKLVIQTKVKVYTNYGEGDLPKFVVPSTPLSGPVISTASVSGITIDGLYLEGARGDGTSGNIFYGICAFLGPKSRILNSEITSCNIGAMLTGEGSLFQGNYVHDLVIGLEGAPNADPSTLGGAEGIFINASNNEVSYNTFVNCSGPADWLFETAACDGGAVEITAGACGTISNVKIHHNYAYDSCGFLQIGTLAGDCKGVVKNSDIYQNLSVDSAWMGFLQVNNTDFANIHYYNNTNVQRADSPGAGNLWILYAGAPSDPTVGELLPGTVFLTNNLFVFDDVTVSGDPIDPNFEQTDNLVIYTADENPGFINIDGNSETDFDLTAESPAVNAGTVVAGNNLDFINRIVADPSGLPDVGAFEHGSSRLGCIPSRSPVKVKLPE